MRKYRSHNIEQTKIGNAYRLSTKIAKTSSTDCPPPQSHVNVPRNRATEKMTNQEIAVRYVMHGTRCTE